MDFEHEHRLTEVEERSKSNTHRISKIENQQNEIIQLVGSVKILAEREQRVENDVKEIKNDVKTLTLKPGKRWDGIVDKIIGTIVGAVFGAFMGFVLSNL